MEDVEEDSDGNRWPLFFRGHGIRGAIIAAASGGAGLSACGRGPFSCTSSGIGNRRAWPSVDCEGHFDVMSKLNVPLILVSHEDDDGDPYSGDRGDGDGSALAASSRLSSRSWFGVDGASRVTCEDETSRRSTPLLTTESTERRARAHSQVELVRTMVPGLSSVAASSFTFANFILAPGNPANLPQACQQSGYK